MEDTEKIALIDLELNGYGEVIFREAGRAGLDLDLACALVNRNREGATSSVVTTAPSGRGARPFATFP